MRRSFLHAYTCARAREHQGHHPRVHPLPLNTNCPLYFHSSSTSQVMNRMQTNALYPRVQRAPSTRSNDGEPGEESGDRQSGIPLKQFSHGHPAPSWTGQSLPVHCVHRCILPSFMLFCNDAKQSLEGCCENGLLDWLLSTQVNSCGHHKGSDYDRIYLMRR